MDVAGRAEFGMYPIESLRWAWDDLWGNVAARLPWAPDQLDHSGDVHSAWADPNVVVNHVCGWPFAASHRSTMSLVGAFDLDLATEAPVGVGHYRSVLLTPLPDRSLETLIGCRAVINSPDSLSGALSLLAATVGTETQWPGDLIVSGSHAASLVALANGSADLACIDAWTLALISAQQPWALVGLHRVGLGPAIPTPAVTVRDASLVAELAEAFADAFDDPATAPARQALQISGWIQPDPSEYTSLIGRIGPALAESEPSR